MTITGHSTNSTKRVESYGLIVRHRHHYLIVQNRDTEAFIYFFYANILKWSANHCRRVFRNFSADEKQRLLFYPFHDIYMDLYVHYQEHTHRRQYEIARRNYEFFKSQPWMIRLLVLTKTCEVPFLFPKGRIEKNETPVECALREFWEETRVDISAFHHLVDTSKCLTYECYRPFYRFISVNHLFVLDLPHEPPLQYTYFPNRLRSLSISNEILYATWIAEEDLSYYLSGEILTAITPILQGRRRSR